MTETDVLKIFIKIKGKIMKTRRMYVSNLFRKLIKYVIPA